MPDLIYRSALGPTPDAALHEEETAIVAWLAVRPAERSEPAAAPTGRLPLRTPDQPRANVSTNIPL